MARALLLWSCALTLATAGTGATATAQDASGNPSLAAPAPDWAVDCAKNEEQVLDHPGSYLRYRTREVDEKGDRLRDQIETPGGNVARLIERDGRLLTADEDAGERARLNGMLNDPSIFARHMRSEQENRSMSLGLLRQMPDAMLWSYAPGQPQPLDQASGETPLVVLDFKPNPKWSPPNYEAKALTGVEGRVWIDAHTRHLVYLKADVFQDVTIGWGLFAKLYPGGTVTLKQVNASGQRWIVDHIDEKVTLRILVKSVKQQLVSDLTDFQPVPSMDYRQAIKMLLDTPLPTH